MTATSETITKLLSFSLTDWVVSPNDEDLIIRSLANDANMTGTIRALHSSGQLAKLLATFDLRRSGNTLVQVLGAGADVSSGTLIDAYPIRTARLKHLFRLSLQVQTKLRALSPKFTKTPFNAASYAAVKPKRATAPFSGVGATGVPATQLSVPPLDQIKMKLDHEATLTRYRNPIPGNLVAYLTTLTPQQRMLQARLLLRRPINSVVPESYLRGRPTRGDIVRLAGAMFSLSPALVAAFVLAEQRDQSRNEDAVEYTAARNPITQSNSSIGLGQVVVSTARREDLFSPLLASATRSRLTHNEIAELLTSEEFNIFAVAKYLRLTANKATKFTAKMLPITAGIYPGIDFAAFGSHSQSWPADNIRALGSEYTSKPWDDKKLGGWGDFVYAAFQDIVAAGYL